MTVPDEQYAPLMKVVKALPFKIKTKAVAPPKPRKLTTAEQEWVDDLKRALHQVELHEQGKIQLQSAYDLLDEL